MTTTSIPVVMPTADPNEDVLDDPRERIRHDPVTFDRLISGEGYPPAGEARLLGAHIKRPSLIDRLRSLLR